MKINIVPKVKKYIDNYDKVSFSKISYNYNLSDFHKSILDEFVDKNLASNLFFLKQSSIKDGAYHINIFENRIECAYSSDEGLHNLICTLRQLLLKVLDLTSCSIYDEPSFKYRSVMIDISRNKVPKLNTLKEIAYHLSLLKINDLQLYIEGRSFYFSFLDKYYEDKSNFLLPEEVVELKEYCKSIGITLTPNINCFGHMAYWLNQEDLNHLAIKPEGFEMSVNGQKAYAQTIDPYNEDAYNLVINQFDELLNCFKDCKRMTIGGDEPFELLFPNRDPNVKDIYLYHMKKIISYIKSKGITPCMWGDVVKEYPDTLDEFKDTILLEWGYDKGHITDKNCKMYKDNNVSYMVCPGTSGWLTFTGRMENMRGNYLDALENGYKNNALGIVITDWNDGGSYSQTPTHLLTYAYGACYAWGDKVEDNSHLHNYLDNHVFNSKLSDLIYDLGNYYLNQDDLVCNMTKLFTSFFSCQIDGINIDIKSYSDCNALSSNKYVLNFNEINKTKEYINNLESRFDDVIDSQYKKELVFIYDLIKHTLLLNEAYLKLRMTKDTYNDISYLYQDIKNIINRYYDIWHYRNKESDYKYSLKRLEMLEFKYEYVLKLLKF